MAATLDGVGEMGQGSPVTAASPNQLGPRAGSLPARQAGPRIVRPVARSSSV